LLLARYGWQQYHIGSTTALAAGRCDCAASVATGKASGLWE